MITTTEQINRLHAVDWTGQKRVTLNGSVPADVTVGELAEAARQRMQLPRGSYAVYHAGEKLSRAATVSEVSLPDEAEFELSPEVKAA